MPILLTNKEYTDIYGNVSTYYKANAGDTISVKYSLSTEIFARSTTTNSWNIDALQKTITQSQGSFLNEGFRVGQTYKLVAVNNSNANTGVTTGTILAVSDLSIKISDHPSVNNWNSGSDSILCLYVEQARKSIELGLNFVDNILQTPSLSSLLDGETNRFVANNLDSLSVGSSLSLTQVGKKSGGFTIASPSIKRIADTVNPYVIFTHNIQNWEVTFDITFIGMFDETWFTGQNCLKLYSRLDFKVNQGETFGVTTIEIKDGADTGFFETGFNTEASNIISTTSDATELFYNKTNTITFEIVANDTSIDDIQIGAMYVQLDEDYNSNKPLPQDSYLPFATSPLWNATNIGDDFSSNVFPYFLTLNDFSYTDAGSERTFAGEIQFDPVYANPNGFGKFIEAKGETERLLYIWVKVGNTNTLLFGNQMTFEMPVGIQITPELSVLVNHDQNLDFSDLSIPSSNSDFNLEDDIAYISDILIYEADVNQSVEVKVVATNGVDEFDLESVLFDLSAQDLNNFIPTYLSVTNNLPTSSAKKKAYLIEKTALTSGVMKLRLYFPFLIHWEYWIDQLNTTAYFKKENTNTKNWYNYQDSPWVLKVKVEISRNGVADYFYKNFTIKNYDDSTVVSDIKIYEYPSMTQVSGLKKNTLMYIEAIHTFPANYSGFPYGQITIEPKQSAPRYVLSTEIDRDNTNPLKGISYTPRLDMTFTSSTIITLSCLLDMNKLQGSNYCITSKISEEGTDNNHVEFDKITEDDIQKVTEDLINKITD